MALAKLRGEDLAGDHKAREQQAHEGDHRGEDAPAFVFAALGGVFGEDGDESDAQRGAGDEIVQKIGQGEGRVVGVGHGVGADLVRHGPFAEKAE